MAAPGQDAAQSTEAQPNGQGPDQDRSFSSILGEDAFSSAPEELRPHLEEYVRTRVDPQLTQRFQESAEFRKTWEPFSQVQGLTDLHPEDVDQLVELGYMLSAAGDESNPQAQQAKESLAEVWEKMGDDFGFFDDDDGEDDDDSDSPNGDEPEYMTREQFEQEMTQRQQQAEQQQSLQQTQQQIQQEIGSHVKALELPGDPGSPERQKAEKAIYSFMGNYVNDSSLDSEGLVKAAFEDYSELVGGAQSDLIEGAEERNGGQTLRGGSGDTAPEEVKGWADADRLAKARLSGAR